MRKPRALTPGDRLGLVAPASPFTREEFDSGLQEIRRLGFEPVYDESVFARQRYVAGPAASRAAAIHAAWRDPSIAGLIGVRGGYGSAQVAALEALVHAVEDDRLPISRVEDALQRQRRAKERFLASMMTAKPAGARALREALGRDEHRAIADEMARFL